MWISKKEYELTGKLIAAQKEYIAQLTERIESSKVTIETLNTHFENVVTIAKNLIKINEDILNKRGSYNG